MTKPIISKSQYVKGVQCPLALWFYRNRKDLKLPISPEQQAIFDNGNNIGVLAQSVFKNGVEVTEPYYKITQAIETTKKLIKAGKEIIFEATAVHPIDGSFSRIDVLQKVPNSDEWDLIEVKSSTKVHDYHYDDMAFQYHVFYGAGFKIRKCLMMVIDNQYVKNGAIDPKKLFRLEDISNEVFAKQSEVESQAGQLGYIASQKIQPSAKIGARCFSPFECDYCHHCWKKVPDYSIYNIFAKKKADEIHEQIKSYELSKIPKEELTSDKKIIDVEAHLSRENHIESERIKEWISELKYPLYFLDYETTMSSLPLFNGTRPYQQVPFQFSLHVQNEPNGELKHFEFIHKNLSDPRENFAKELIKVCGKSGSVVVYNQSFEESRNKELAEAFPQYLDALISINERMVDLLIPFRNRWLYSPKQKSSASIKAVLPAFTNLNYDNMEIGNGGDAMGHYLAFAQGKIPSSQQKELWKNLSEYCKLDTLAMVELLNVLEKNKNLEKSKILGACNQLI